jgi:hypothetical protein
MLDNHFEAAMSLEDLLIGEARHADGEQSRKLAMAAGLTKSSEELQRAWQDDHGLYLTALSGAIAAYEENKNIEELLVGCIARLVSVVDEGGDLVDSALEILSDGNADKAS